MKAVVIIERGVATTVIADGMIDLRVINMDTLEIASASDKSLRSRISTYQVSCANDSDWLESLTRITG